MTDGIIQKVIRENNVPNMSFFNYTNYEVRTIIAKIENELIEEIKKELSDRNYEDYIDKPIIEELKRIITGDNQE